MKMSGRRLPGSRATFKDQKLVIVEAVDRALSESGVKRVSSLAARIIRLEEHNGVIHACRFDPQARVLMSAGSDKYIYLSPIRGDFNRVMVIKAHTKAVTDVHFSEERECIYSCSLDGTVAVWDAFKGLRLNTFKGHSGGVNSLHKFKQHNTVCSGSNDGTIRLWDNRMNACSGTFKNCYSVTSVSSNLAGDIVYSGSSDKNITFWDIRTWRSLCQLEGHTHFISSIALSPCGTKLLSNSRDNTVRIWDIRPYASGDRCLGMFIAHHSVYESSLLKCTWHRDGVKIAFGTSDRCVHVWDTIQKKLIYNIPGHANSVVDVDFHPLEPIIASCSSNQHLYLHEI